MEKEKLVEWIDEEIDNANSWIENEEIWDGESDMHRQRKFREMLTEIKEKLENPFTLSENQKKLVCDYYNCSDGHDKQYPECHLRHENYAGCGIEKTERFFEILTEGAL